MSTKIALNWLLLTAVFSGNIKKWPNLVNFFTKNTVFPTKSRNSTRPKRHPVL